MITDVPSNPQLPDNPTAAFPLVYVNDLGPLRTFYRDVLGFSITYDLPRYLQVQLTSRGEAGPELCFMLPSPGQPVLNGGFVLSIPVQDADAVQDALDAAGVPITARAEDKPWGWRSVFVTDPAGVVLDFFHTLPAADPA